MNNKCINLKQKFNKELGCKKKDKIINIRECSNCKYKEYKDVNKSKVIHKQTKRTKATSITKEVKIIVWERDSHRCIFCGCLVPWNLANSHFIKRSHGGLGIPKNLFCNCLECHNKFDNSKYRLDMLPIARNYLKSKYDDWNEEDLVYKKR